MQAVCALCRYGHPEPWRCSRGASRSRHSCSADCAGAWHFFDCRLTPAHTLPARTTGNQSPCATKGSSSIRRDGQDARSAVLVRLAGSFVRLGASRQPPPPTHGVWHLSVMPRTTLDCPHGFLNQGAGMRPGSFERLLHLGLSVTHSTVFTSVTELHRSLPATLTKCYATQWYAMQMGASHTTVWHNS